MVHIRLLLTSRRGVTTAYQKRVLAFWRSKGVQIEVSTLDVGKLDEARKIVELAQSMGDLAGVYHLAVVSASSTGSKRRFALKIVFPIVLL